LPSQTVTSFKSKHRAPVTFAQVQIEVHMSNGTCNGLALGFCKHALQRSRN